MTTLPDPAVPQANDNAKLGDMAMIELQSSILQLLEPLPADLRCFQLVDLLAGLIGVQYSKLLGSVERTARAKLVGETDPEELAIAEWRFECCRAALEGRTDV
jgi:hypothetical protein